MASKGNAKHYRRGLVLGLTLAEVFLLLLFLLLLVFSYLLNIEKIKWEPVKEVLIEANLPADTTAEMQTSVATLRDQVESYESVVEALPDADSMITAINEFVELKERLRDQGVEVDDPDVLRTRLQAMSDADLLAKEYENVCGDLERLKDQLSNDFEAPTAQAALETCPSDKRLDVSSLEPESMEEAKQIIERLQRTNSRLNKSLTDLSGGRGLVYPPCWASPSNPDRPIYSYNVSIKDEGLVVELGDDRTGQDLSVFKNGARDPDYDRTLSRREYLSQTRGLFNWSVDNQCRFFVRVIDDTSADNKSGYKDYLATVETHFYKYLVR